MTDMGEGEAKLTELRCMVEGMDGLDRAMAEDLLWAYVELWGDVRELSAQLARDGLLIEVEKGGAGNRHIELVKNPAFDMRHKATAQLADLAAKIRRFVTLSGVDNDRDEFTEFLSS